MSGFCRNRYQRLVRPVYQARVCHQIPQIGHLTYRAAFRTHGRYGKKIRFLTTRRFLQRMPCWLRRCHVFPGRRLWCPDRHGDTTLNASAFAQQTDKMPLTLKSLMPGQAIGISNYIYLKNWFKKILLVTILGILGGLVNSLSVI